ncbi:MAG: cysteine desulfurase family protein [Bacteroidota bacterium]
MQHTYLDYSATTPLDAEVLEVIEQHLAGTYGNASSVHSFGRSAKVVLEESREQIAGVIGAEPAEVFFTSGGTESNNHVIIGSAMLHRRTSGKDHLLVSATEHHAVLDCAEYLRGLGFTITIIPVDANGYVNTDVIAGLLTEKTFLVSVMHANNETGTIQPIETIARVTAARGIHLHSDTVQTVGKIPVRTKDLGVDLLSISAHKIYGPKGIGALFIKKGTELDPIVHGGAQERNNRAGTENIPLIAGFAKAMELAERNREQLYRKVSELKSVLTEIIRSSVSGVIFNSDSDPALPHILSVSLEASQYDVESETLLLMMDLNGIAISSGSACTSGSVQPSHVLLAMGRDMKTTQATIRFSFGKFTTIDEVTRAGEIFCSIVRTLPQRLM